MFATIFRFAWGALRLVFASALFMIGGGLVAGELEEAVARWDTVIAEATAKDGPNALVRIDDFQVDLPYLKYMRNELAKEAGLPVPKAATPSGTAYQWPGGIVYYQFDATVKNATDSAKKMQAFQDAYAEWAMFANLTFTEGTGSGFYLLVKEQAGLNGGFATLGKSSAGQDYVIGDNSWNRNTLVHELGHSLGLWHEHMRSDRDAFVTYNSSNVAAGDQSQFTKLLAANTTNVTAYDYLSVMHYARNAFAINPAIDTLTPVNPAYLNEIGAQDDRCLSKLDRQGIATMYGAGPALSTVVTNTLDAGVGSLRAAIYKAWDTATAGSPITITFNISGGDTRHQGGYYTIPLTGTMTRPGPYTTIDGNSQPLLGGDSATGPRIVLDGSQGPAFAVHSGLRLTDNNCTVKGLIIRGFPQDGVKFDGAGSFGSTLSGCRIGTNNGGNGISANAWYGVEIIGGAHNNTIGGSTATDRNVISSNTLGGISITGSGSSANTVKGNYIGLDLTGSHPLGNAGSGVSIRSGAAANVVGGVTAGGRNVISSNTGNGIYMDGTGTTGNLVQGNYLGVGATGTSSMPNTAQAIAIFAGAGGNTIGGGSAGAGNLLCADTGKTVVYLSDADSTLVAGNWIGLDSSGFTKNAQYGVSVYSSDNVTIGGPSASYRNAFGQSGDYALTMQNCAGGAVQGNTFGLDPTAVQTRGIIFQSTVYIDNCTNTTIGGPTASYRNVIAGNFEYGIYMNAGTGNFIQNNYIGVDATGADYFPGISNYGMYLYQPINLTVGGVGRGNVVAGQDSDNITLNGGSGNTIIGNYLGMNATGTAVLGNTNIGVDVFGSSSNTTIGGPSAGNVIAGQSGKHISVGSSSGCVIQCNYLGLNAAGTTGLGSTTYGVFADNTPGVQIGAPGKGNVIGATKQPIQVQGAASTGLVIQGNLLGTDATGTLRLSSDRGISLYGIPGALVGGQVDGAANYLRGSNEAFSPASPPLNDLGICLFNGCQNTRISRNSVNGYWYTTIYLNAGDNDSQVAPSLSTATLTTTTNISGSVSGTTANRLFLVEFFSGDTGTGAQPLTRYLGSTTFTTDPSGNKSFTANLPAYAPKGSRIYATLTDTVTLNTSAASNFVSPGSAQAGPAVTANDVDLDGIPAEYEGPSTVLDDTSGHGGDAAVDSDSDGFSNFEEFKAGTSEVNGADRPSISAVWNSVTGLCELKLPTKTGRIYNLSRAASVSGPYLPFQYHILGTGSTLTIQDPGSGSTALYYYKAIVGP